MIRVSIYFVAQGTAGKTFDALKHCDLGNDMITLRILICQQGSLTTE